MSQFRNNKGVSWTTNGEGKVTIDKIDANSKVHLGRVSGGELHINEVTGDGIMYNPPLGKVTGDAKVTINRVHVGNTYTDTSDGDWFKLMHDVPPPRLVERQNEKDTKHRKFYW